MDNISQVYIPDHQKWEKYYNDMLYQRQAENMNGQNTTNEFLVSKQTTKSESPQETVGEPLKVKLVSPVKQSNDQVISENCAVNRIRIV